VSSSHRYSLIIATLAVSSLSMTAEAQSSVAISPFVSYVPSAARNPLAGMALTFGGTTGLALRAGADMSVSNPSATSDGTTGSATGGIRPWGADADLMLFLGGIGGGTTLFSRSLSPYVFSGLGMSGNDSAGTNVVRHGWSYGAGVSLPLGFDADVFGEGRWRMSEYVLPTSKGAPDSKSEMRFGLSFHVGGGSRGGSNDFGGRGRGRRHADVYDDDTRIVAAPAPVIVQQPAPVIVQEPVAAATSTVTTVDPEQEPVSVQRSVMRPNPNVIAGPATQRSSTVSRSTTVTRSTTTARRGSRGIVYRSRTAAAARSSSSTSVKASTRSSVKSASSSAAKQRTKREIMRRKRQ